MTRPLHHIDASIIIESEHTIDGKFCTKYLQKLNYNYDGSTSLPALGELMISILLLRDAEKRHAFLDFLFNLRNTRKITFYTPVDTSSIVRKVKDLDTRIGPTDAEIIACAIEAEANNLVTLDRKIIGNKAIEREFKLRIVHPKDLL